MDINISQRNNNTTLSWKKNEDKISLKFPGRVDAMYSLSKNLIIAIGEEGFIKTIKTDGTILDESPLNQPENSEFYLLEKSKLSVHGIAAVMAYEPELNQERFWLHEIDFDNKKIGCILSKWR